VVASTGAVTTLAGGGCSGCTTKGAADGLGTAATMQAFGIALRNASLTPAPNNYSDSLILADSINDRVRAVCRLPTTTPPPPPIPAARVGDLDGPLFGGAAAILLLGIGATLWLRHCRTGGGKTGGSKTATTCCRFRGIAAAVSWPPPRSHAVC
jgi:hypothetical protein